MEEIEEIRSNFMSVNFNDEGEESRSRTTIFSELKQYCIHLLELLQNPKKDPHFFSQLHRFLLRSSPDSLQPFFDYTLFPLLLLLDAAVDCRSSPNVDSKESSMMIDVPKTPHKMSDTVAEGVLQCLEELLKKCQLGSLDQMVVVLKKLTNGALLSPSEAAEEFRGGVIRCFRALLLSIHVCSYNSCSCKQNNGWPALLKRNEFQSPLTGVSIYNSEPECSLAFLQSQNASPAVGHWLSLLLKAADTEAGRGQRGSAKLRVEAFVTLRILVAKVGTADALSFFVPGVVSQFGKVLHVAKTMISGAAGSAESLDQAIRGLAEFLMIVLEDDANLSSLDESVDIIGLHPNKEKSPQSILEELRHLPVKTLEQSQIVSKDLRGEVVDKSAPKVGFKEKGSKNRESMIGSLHVDRTKDWIVKTSAHVDKLLSATFPHLCVHPAKKVRQGLLAAIEGLLSKCCYTLKESRLMLLSQFSKLHDIIDKFAERGLRSLAIAKQVDDNICKFAKKGLTPSQIGVILGDSQWIAQVKSVTEEAELQCVPGQFEYVEEYVRVFEPLLFEECRAQLYSTWEELTETISRDLHVMVRIKNIERRERGWYDVILLPANECKWTFKEGDVAVLSSPRPGAVRSRRSTTEEHDPEVSRRLSGTMRRHIPMDSSITIIGRKWITGMRNVDHGLVSSNQTGPLSIFG